MLEGTRVGHPALEGGFVALCTLFSLGAFLLKAPEQLLESSPPAPSAATLMHSPAPEPSSEGSLWVAREGQVADGCGVFLVAGHVDGFVEVATPGGGISLVMPSLNPDARQNLCETLARTAVLGVPTEVGVVATAEGLRRVTATPRSHNTITVSLSPETKPDPVIGLSREQQTAVQLQQIVDTVDGMTRDLTALEGVARGRERGDDISTHTGAPAAAE